MSNSFTAGLEAGNEFITYAMSLGFVQDTAYYLGFLLPVVCVSFAIIGTLVMLVFFPLFMYISLKCPIAQYPMTPTAKDIKLRRGK